MQHYRQRRHMTNQDARLRRGEDVWRVVIVNATAEGLRLRTDAPLMLEDEVVVESSAWSTPAVVVWMRDGAVGLRLTSPLNALALGRITGKSMRLNRKSRVGFGQWH